MMVANLALSTSEKITCKNEKFPLSAFPKHMKIHGVLLRRLLWSTPLHDRVQILRPGSDLVILARQGRYFCFLLAMVCNDKISLEHTAVPTQIINDRESNQMSNFSILRISFVLKSL
jgi:hypothetical protein